MSWLVKYINDVASGLLELLSPIASRANKFVDMAQKACLSPQLRKA